MGGRARAWVNELVAVLASVRVSQEASESTENIDSILLSFARAFYCGCIFNSVMAFGRPAWKCVS